MDPYRHCDEARVVMFSLILLDVLLQVYNRFEISSRPNVQSSTQHIPSLFFCRRLRGLWSHLDQDPTHHSLDVFKRQSLQKLGTSYDGFRHHLYIAGSIMQKKIQYKAMYCATFL
jgi:hypothetical protein